MKTNGVFFVLFIVTITIAGACKKNNGGADRQEKVLAAVEGVMKAMSDSLQLVIPSLSVLIQTPADKIFVSAAADPGARATAATRFRFASNTKNFTAASILNMYEAGWLDYKAKIIDLIPGSSTPYVPATADWDFPNKNLITIEQLLQHGAGVFDVDNDSVPGYNGLSYVDYIKQTDPTHQFTTGELVKVVKDGKLVYFAPGAGYHYSNTGYSILSEIIKRVYTLRAGKEKTYADYLDDSITGSKAPVPLLTVHFPVLSTDAALPDPHAVGTSVTSTGTVIYDRSNMSAHVGEGNGYGTMEDMNTYIRSLMTGRNVLQGSTIQIMQKGVSLSNPHYGLGCGYTANLGYGHNGAIMGYSSTMAYDPVHDVSVVVIMPFWDLRNGVVSFARSFTAVTNAAYAARTVLGFPGKP